MSDADIILAEPAERDVVLGELPFRELPQSSRRLALDEAED